MKRNAAASFEMVYRLKDPDAEVASATAVTLGRIGGLTEGTVLAAALANASGRRRLGGRGLHLVRGEVPGRGNRGQAVRLRPGPPVECPQATHPRGRAGRFSPGRGRDTAPRRATPLARQGAPRHRPEHVARVAGPGGDRRPGRRVGPRRTDLQVLLVLALADRDEPHALGAVLEAAKSGPLQFRLAAIRGLARHGNSSCIPVLLDIAAESTPGLSEPALAVLADLPDNEVNAAVIGRLNSADGKRRLVLVQLAGRRHIAAATPALLKAAGDTDAQLRLAALTALGAVVGPDDLPLLISRAVRRQRRRKRPSPARRSAAAIRMPDREACREADRRPGRGAGRIEGPVDRNPRRRGRREPARGRRGRCQGPRRGGSGGRLPGLGRMDVGQTPRRIVRAWPGRPANDSLQIRPSAATCGSPASSPRRTPNGWPCIARPLRRPVATTNAGWPSRSCCGSARPSRWPWLWDTPRPGAAETAGKVAVGIADKIVARHPAAVAQALPQVIAATEQGPGCQGRGALRSRREQTGK